MNKPTILLLYGGESPEHAVSIMSAANVAKAIDTEKYDVLYGFITKNGEWHLLDSFQKEPNIVESKNITLVPAERSVITSGGEMLRVDAVFPVLHGENGEDGTIQGLCRVAHIPVVGCSLEPSAVCIDKYMTKLVVASSADVNVVPWVRLVRGINESIAEEELVRQLGEAPWFVKPSRCGSSVGVTKVAEYSRLQEAITEAFTYDNSVLIEAFIEGRELEVAVIGRVPNHRAGGVGEITAGSDFYDYDDKYSELSKAVVDVNPDMSDDLRTEVLRVAKDTYAAVGCDGLARVDMFLRQDGTIFLNEINTMPGFTNISMFPKIWMNAGMSYEALVDELIGIALSDA